MASFCALRIQQISIEILQGSFYTAIYRLG